MPATADVEDMTAPFTGGAESDEVSDVQHTSCIVVGGGPAGMVLALLLARRGVPVTVLEAHEDFDRQFRGDTLHPGILEILDRIGLTEALHAIPHVKWTGPSLRTAAGPVKLMDLGRLRSKFPYIMVVPQERFLALLAAEAAKYPHFRLVMRARVQQLVTEGDAVRGVRYREHGAAGWREVRAPLTIGADGRFSRVRALAGIESVKLSEPMELLWFRLPRIAGESFSGNAFATMTTPGGEPAMSVYRGDGFLAGAVDRIDHWQMLYIYPAGSYPAIKAAGLDALRRSIAEVEPGLAAHLESLTDWRQLAPLSVAFARCRRWYRPGLLLIGDAAHVMTPAAGAGIKYAIEDAVEAVNVLAGPLLRGGVTTGDLARVQRRRRCATQVIQAAGALQQRTVLRDALRRGSGTGAPLALPLAARLFLKLPFVRDLPARFISFGIRRVRLADASDVAAG